MTSLPSFRFNLFLLIVFLFGHTVESLRLVSAAIDPPGELMYKGSVLSENEVKDRLKNKTAVFMLPLGPGRDQDLQYIRANMEKIGDLFNNFEVIIGTPGNEAAKNWQSEAQSGKCNTNVCHTAKAYNVGYTTEETKLDYGPCNSQKKPCRIGRGRDAILNFMREQIKQGKKYDFSIAVDSDMAKQWNTQSFLKAFSLMDSEWGAVVANGRDPDGHHSDWLAFQSHVKYERNHHFDPDGSPFEVIHGFGGVAIYRTAALLQCDHRGGGGVGHCEHHHLQDCLHANEHKIYFHPGLVIEWPGKHTNFQTTIDSWK